MKQSALPEPRRELAAFFTAAFFVSWLLWFPALPVGNRIFFAELPHDFLLRAGSFGPSAAGLLLAYKFGGKTELRALLKSMWTIRIRPNWLLLLFLTMPGVSAVSCLIVFLSGGSLPEPQFSPWFVPVAFLYILVLMGPLGEEAGWRGFALKRMLTLFSPLKAAVLLGGIWSLWHLPLFFIEGTTQNLLAGFGFLPAFCCYLLYTVMISILITLFFVKSGGSVLAAILSHTMGNLSLGCMPLIFSKGGALLLLLVLGGACFGFVYLCRGVMLNRKVSP